MGLKELGTRLLWYQGDIVPHRGFKVLLLFDVRSYLVFLFFHHILTVANLNKQGKFYDFVRRSTLIQQKP